MQAFRPVPDRNVDFAYQPVNMLGKRANPFTIPYRQVVRLRQMPPMCGRRTVSAADKNCLASKALLFLYNNLRVVHRAQPTVPWCELPKLIRENRERFLIVNDGYLFRSCGEVFRRHFLARKELVAHPRW